MLALCDTCGHHSEDSYTMYLLGWLHFLEFLRCVCTFLQSTCTVVELIVPGTRKSAWLQWVVVQCRCCGHPCMYSVCMCVCSCNCSLQVVHLMICLDEIVCMCVHVMYVCICKVVDCTVHCAQWAFGEECIIIFSDYYHLSLRRMYVLIYLYYIRKYVYIFIYVLILTYMQHFTYCFSYVRTYGYTLRMYMHGSMVPLILVLR